MKKNAFQSSRRQLIKTVGVVGAAMSLSPSSAIAQLSSQSLNSSTSNFSFVSDDGIGPRMDAPYVEENFSALHAEIPLPSMPEDSPQYQNALRVLQQEFAAEGNPWRDEYKLRWTYQHYGVPDTQSHSAPLLEYCNDVQSYLYNHIDGLSNLQQKWERLKFFQDVVDENHALVGKYTYFVLRINAVNEAGEVVDPYLVNAMPVERAIHYISNEKTQPKQRLIYVIQGATSLVSPFSEMLHLSTHAPAMRYANELSQDLDKRKAKNLARSSGETVTESAAVLLALNYMQDIGEDKFAKKIIHHANSLTNQLPQFSGSIAYMKKYGIQAAFDNFQEDPSDYMERIDDMG